MKLSKEQEQEIKDQQSQQNKTKRVTVLALEDILYEAKPALDHNHQRFDKVNKKLLNTSLRFII